MAKTRTNQPVYLDKDTAKNIYVGLDSTTTIDVRIIDDFVFVNMHLVPLSALTPAETICTLPQPVNDVYVEVSTQGSNPSFGVIKISKTNGMVNAYGMPLPNATMNVYFFYKSV